VDSVPSLKAWADSLGGITYPLLSDFFPHGAVAQKFGVLRKEGYTERAIFVIDKQGTIRYVDVHDIDQQPNNDVLFAELFKLEPQAGVALMQKAEPSSPEPAADVVMYCTQWCPGCRSARAFLKEHHIDFVEVDITKDRGAAARVRGWAEGNETTPTFKIRGTVVVDWDQRRVAKLLGLE
jgi:glutaredoxin